MATDFGVNHLSPVLGEFLSDFPDITVNMVLNNRYVELISEGFDMAVRIGELEDSTLRARKLTETTKRMIGSPGYFQKYGRPLKIDDLNDHKLLHYSNQSSGNVWKLTAPSGEKRQVRTAGWLTVNDGQSLLNAAISRTWHRLSAQLPLRRCAGAGAGRRGDPGAAGRDAGHLRGLSAGPLYPAQGARLHRFPGAPLCRQGAGRLVGDRPTHTGIARRRREATPYLVEVSITSTLLFSARPASVWLLARGAR